MNINSNNINNYNNINARDSIVSANADGNTKLSNAAKSVVASFEGVMKSSLSPMSNTEVSKNMNSFASGIKDVEEALRMDALAAKDSLKALFNKMSVGDVAGIYEEGKSINDLDSEELVDIVDRIKIMLEAYNENYRAFAGAFESVSKEAVEDAAFGNTALSVADALRDSDLPYTKDNKKSMENALNMALDVSKSLPLDDEAKVMLIKDAGDITLDNVYKAIHSTQNGNIYSNVSSHSDNAISDKEWKEMLPQVKKMLMEDGISNVSDKQLDDARFLLNNGIEINAGNVALKDLLDNLTIGYGKDEFVNELAEALLEYNDASLIMLDGANKSTKKMAAEVIRVVDEATYLDVDKIVEFQRKLTIQEMMSVLAQKEDDNGNQQSGNTGANQVSENAQVLTEKQADARRVLMEAKLLMSQGAVTSIINKGIDVYSEDLRVLVDILKSETNDYITAELTKADKDVTPEDIDKVLGVNDMILGLGLSPLGVVGTFANTSVSEVTITNVMEASASFSRQYNEASWRYEVMSTKVTKSMGDSLSKAVDNSIESLLANLDLEKNDNNIRAVKILAFNNMDVNYENVIAVREKDSILNELMDNMTPKVVLDMIKNGIDPTATDIKTLNEFILNNYEKEPTEKYSEFLYKLDSNNQIEPADREKYIGIFKMINNFKKDAGKAVGALVNQNLDINMRNLMAATLSQNSYDFDVTLTEESGIAQISGGMYYKNLFEQLSNTMSLAAINQAKKDGIDINDLSPEMLYELRDRYQDEVKEESVRLANEQINDLSEYQDADDHIIRILTDNKMPVSYYNLVAADTMLNNDTFLSGVKEAAKENDIKEVEDAVDGLIESFSDSDMVQGAYDNLTEQVAKDNERVLSQINADTTYLDVKSLRNSFKTISFVQNLAKRSEYFIPYEKENASGTIHLKIEGDNNNEGKLWMSFESEGYGKFHGSFKVRKNQVSGFVTLEKAESKDTLLERLETISSDLAQMGIDKVNVTVANANEDITIVSNGESDVATAFVYRVAKTIFTNLI